MGMHMNWRSSINYTIININDFVTSVCCKEDVKYKDLRGRLIFQGLDGAKE